MVIVIVSPSFDQPSSVTERAEQSLVQQFVAQAPVEALDEAVLHRLARRDVVLGDARFLLPAQDGRRHELRVVVADHHCGPTALSDQGVQLTSDAMARQRGVSHQSQALACEVIDDGQDAGACSGEFRVSSPKRVRAARHRPIRRVVRGSRHLRIWKGRRPGHSLAVNSA